MAWEGPGWGMIASLNDKIGKLEKNNDAWKKYAAKIEKELAEVWDLYREAQGNGTGQRVVKEAAVSEIEKLDPRNKMLDKAHRQAIFDKAKAEEQQIVDAFRKSR